MRELAKDNKKKGKARGANGKVRSRKQMIAIALSVTGKQKKSSVKKDYNEAISKLNKRYVKK